MEIFTEKKFLITGGTGSFGSIVTKELLKYPVKEIVVFSRDELKQERLRLSLKNDKIKYFIGDIRDYSSIELAMKNIDYVFHAAALKQVPSCEFFPMEAVKTNIIGTENVLNAALKNDVSKVVNLSTDKAVYPINAMGLTKGIMEKIMMAKARSSCENLPLFCATRYGNIMASRGSVIPLFVECIKSKKPITITDPSMTRFLMSLDDSVDLVFEAFKNAKQGDIYIQKSPASTIGDLAKALLEIFDADLPIKIIGTRHGEKLYESLLSREEMAKSIDLGKYYRIPLDNRDLNYEKYFIKGQESFSISKDYTSHNTERLSIEEIKKTLLNLSYIQKEIKC